MYFYGCHFFMNNLVKRILFLHFWWFLNAILFTSMKFYVFFLVISCLIAFQNTIPIFESVSHKFVYLGNFYFIILILVATLFSARNLFYHPQLAFKCKLYLIYFSIASLNLFFRSSAIFLLYQISIYVSRIMLCRSLIPPFFAI